MTPACSSISLFPSAQTKNTRDGPTAAFPKDSILIRMGKPRIQPTISFVISFIPAWAGKTRSIDSRQDSKHSSSPLTQGKLSQCNRQRLLARLIPAHAGKTLRGCGRGGLRGAHPRSRGENMVIRGAWYRLIGSSPLTRGKLGARRAEIERVRLIPAHAGKTSASSQSSRQRTAHPRSRGENGSACSMISVRSGSSPLTRGKLRRTGPRSCQCRLIPAHAGKTLGNRLPRYRNRAHPRSRGENILHLTKPLRGVGSSPLTRGKPFPRAFSAVPNGLIPAHAGKTLPWGKPLQALPAHPRSRGENDPEPKIGTDRPGSSPLTRGKRRLRCRGAGVAGLIPAHAGKTRSSSLTNSLKPAHPRSRGENRVQMSPRDHCVGSSPLTRGKRFLVAARDGV